MSQEVRLVSVATEGGGVQLTGPIDNQALCYGLLEIARDLVRDRAKQRAQQRVVPASVILPSGHAPSS